MSNVCLYISMGFFVSLLVTSSIDAFIGSSVFNNVLVALGAVELCVFLGCYFANALTLGLIVGSAIPVVSALGYFVWAFSSRQRTLRAELKAIRKSHNSR